MRKIKIKKVNYEKIPTDVLLLADPSKESIEKYLKKGHCFVAVENNKVVGCYILNRKNKNALEIMNIVVIKRKRNKGIGKMLVNDAIKRAKKEGVKRLLVGTGNSSINQLAFYQKCGFRISGIRKDYFIKKYKDPIYENRIQCRDMVVLELALQK